MLFRRPNPAAIERFLLAQSALDYSYAAVGATAATPPAGYAVDQVRVRLGRGERTFATAKQSLRQWRQFQLGWIEATPATTPIAPGAVVAVLVRAAGAWWLNASRIVYVVDEAYAARVRFGFAYGTLPGHAETGEERFLIEHDLATDEVWYSILAFSRPRHPLARLGASDSSAHAAALRPRVCRGDGAGVQLSVHCLAAGQDGRAI